MSRFNAALAASFLLAAGLPAATQAHVVFAPPRTYANPQSSPGIDLSPQKGGYLLLGDRAYDAALAQARAMQRSIDQFLEHPTPASHAAARQAWIDARRAYSQTELFRFNDGPIDAPPSEGRAAGPEMRINAWPIDESTLDYVVGARDAGFVNEHQTPVTLEAILSRDQVVDESAVTTGWHAIEFLIWGQDTNDDGPGQRSHRDFVAGSTSNERRRDVLRLVTQQLLVDLAQVSAQWRSGEAKNYAAQLHGTAPVEVLGRALHGATSFVAIELFGERLSVALDSRSQEDEHSCFSDTTHLDLRYGLLGVANLLRGEYAGERTAPGVIEIIAFQDPALGRRLSEALARAIEHVDALQPPFDRLILRPDSHPDRQQAEATVAALHELARAMKASAEALGIRIIVPGV